MQTIPEQLFAAMRARGWTIKRLLAESGLQCDRTSLARKLKGQQPLDPDEIQTLVDTLATTVAVVPSREAM